MKKILAMLLALACVLSFAACASKKTDDTIGEEKPSTSEQMPTEPEAPTEEPDAPAEKPADDENAAKPDDGMLDDEFGVGEPSERTGGRRRHRECREYAGGAGSSQQNLGKLQRRGKVPRSRRRL